MKIKELIEILQEQDQELEVVVYADHGQTPMKAWAANETHVEDLNQYMMEEIADEDLEEYDDPVKVFCISG